MLYLIILPVDLDPTYAEGLASNAGVDVNSLCYSEAEHYRCKCYSNSSKVTNVRWLKLLRKKP